MSQYCAGCGNSLAMDARFCSACGKQVVEGFTVPHTRSPFVRPLAGRKIGGVCQGLANYFGWEVTLTRVIAVLITIATIPLAIVAYLLLWVIVPQEPQTAVAVSPFNTAT